MKLLLGRSRSSCHQVGCAKTKDRLTTDARLAVHQIMRTCRKRDFAEALITLGKRKSISQN
jgi:hypothetical protein